MPSRMVVLEICFIFLNVFLDSKIPFEIFILKYKKYSGTYIPKYIFQIKKLFLHYGPENTLWNRNSEI